VATPWQAVPIDPLSSGRPPPHLRQTPTVLVNSRGGGQWPNRPGRWISGSARAVALFAVPVGLHAAVLAAQSPTPGDTSTLGHAGERGPIFAPPVSVPTPAAATMPTAPTAPAGPAAVVAAPDSGSVPLATGPADTPPFIVLADTGTHVYALIPAESDDIHTAIERAIAHMNFIVRPIARRRLTRANRPSPMLTFAVRSDTLVVTFEGLNPVITPLNGDTVRWRRGATGETYTVHIAQAGDTLRQTIATDDGLRENAFLFLEGGTVVEMRVTLIAQRLPTPLHYTEVFREVRGPGVAPD
jgi:hypothetical protein